MTRLDTSFLQQFCTLGPRPIVMTGLLRMWLIRHFSSADNVEDQAQTIRKLVWQTNIKNAGIVIESITRWTKELTEKRPAVMIKRNGWKRIKLGIGDRMQGTSDQDAQTAYGNAWQGSHTLFCIAGSGAEAEVLCAEVYREINQFAQQVRAAADLLRIEVTEVGEVAELEEAKQNFFVPVVVGYGFMEQWRIRQEVPVAKTLDLSLLMP